MSNISFVSNILLINKATETNMSVIIAIEYTTSEYFTFIKINKISFYIRKYYF